MGCSANHFCASLGRLHASKSSRFLENKWNEICSHLSKKGPVKQVFAPDELKNHTNEGKGNRKKRERREKKQRLLCLVFILASLEIFLIEKVCLTRMRPIWRNVFFCFFSITLQYGTMFSHIVSGQYSNGLTELKSDVRYSV